MNSGSRITVLSFLLLFFFPPMVLAAQWKEKTLPHFKILYVSQDDHYAETLHRNLEGIRSRIVSDIGEVNIPPTKVYIVPSHARMMTLQPRGSNIPPWAAAAAFSRKNLILIRSPRLLRGKRKDIVKTAAHEVSHVLLGRAVGGRFVIPRWLNEGFAMYEAGEWGLGETTTMMWVSVTDSFYPFEELTSGFPEKEQEVRIAYLQSISMVSYLLDKYGREDFILFIRRLREHKNLNYALKLTYGMTMRQLETRWHKKVRVTYSWIPIGTSISALWFLFTWLLVVGYIRKRVQARKKLRQWEIEEAEGRWTDFE